MVGRVMISLLLVGMIGLGAIAYQRWSQNRAMTTGDVFPDANSGSKSNSDSDSKSDRTVAPAVTLPATAPAPNPPQVAPPAPAGDSIPPNPPNRAIFAGSGRFQVYRQGNLTWRIDTATGQSCILFASKAAWRMPEIYRHGCNGSGASNNSSSGSAFR